MELNSRTIPTAVSVLACLFILFNVGLPVVLSVCPMMTPELACCAPSKSVESKMRISTQAGDCCGKYIAAERNTIPYLNVEKYQSPHLTCLHGVAPEIGCEYPLSTISSAAVAGSPPPATVHEPIFLLNSSLLI